MFSAWTMLHYTSKSAESVTRKPRVRVGSMCSSFIDRIVRQWYDSVSKSLGRTEVERGKEREEDDEDDGVDEEEDYEEDEKEDEEDDEEDEEEAE